MNESQSSGAEELPVPTRTRPSIGASLRTLRSNLAAMPRAVWILCFGTFLNKFGGFVIPFLALYMTGRGFSMADASLALMSYGGGHFIASGLGGYLTDRLGRRNTIVLSMFLAAATLMLLSAARSLTSIVLLSGLVGLAGEFYRPACSALLADLVPSGQRVTAFATYRLALNAGWAFGPATAGFLAEHSYFWLFAGDAFTSALFGVVAWAALPHGLRSRGGDCRWSTAFNAVRRDRRFLQLVAATFLVALVFFQMSSTYGLQVTALGLSTTVYGVLISLNGVLVVLLELPISAVAQRFPTRRVMALGYVLIGLGFTVNAWAAGIPWLIVAITVFTLGEMVCMPVSFAYLADLAPESMRGRYMGMFGYTWSVALLSGPSLGILLFERSPVTLWGICGGLGLLAAWIITRRDARGVSS